MMDHTIDLGPGDMGLSEVADACLLLGTPEVLIVALMVPV